MRSGWDCKAQRTGLCSLSGASSRLALSTRILDGSGYFPNGVLTDRPADVISTRLEITTVMRVNSEKYLSKTIIWSRF